MTPSTPSGLGGRIQAIARARRKDTVTTAPLTPGRDPLVRRGTEKGRFFKGDWRTTWPRDFKVREGGEEV